MKIEDLKKLNKCVRVLENIQRAKEQALNYEPDYDSGGITGICDSGYFCNLSEHHDGSGQKIDLSGCYVASEVYQSVYEILDSKEWQIKQYLKNLGVEV